MAYKCWPNIFFSTAKLFEIKASLFFSCLFEYSWLNYATLDIIVCSCTTTRSVFAPHPFLWSTRHGRRTILIPFFIILIPFSIYCILHHHLFSADSCLHRLTRLEKAGSYIRRATREKWKISLLCLGNGSFWVLHNSGSLIGYLYQPCSSSPSSF